MKLLVASNNIILLYIYKATSSKLILKLAAIQLSTPISSFCEMENPLHSNNRLQWVIAGYRNETDILKTSSGN